MSGNPFGGFVRYVAEEHAWIHENLNPDFQTCRDNYPTDRWQSLHYSNIDEKWAEEDRHEMLKVIKTIKVPFVHYDISEDVNKPIKEIFETLGNSIHQNDVLCIGIFPKDNRDMRKKIYNSFEQHTSIV